MWRLYLLRSDAVAVTNRLLNEISGSISLESSLILSLSLTSFSFSFQKIKSMRRSGADLHKFMFHPLPEQVSIDSVILMICLTGVIQVGGIVSIILNRRSRQLNQYRCNDPNQEEYFHSGTDQSWSRLWIYYIWKIWAEESVRSVFRERVSLLSNLIRISGNRNR